jgi:hypothetical protein
MAVELEICGTISTLLVLSGTTVRVYMYGSCHLRPAWFICFAHLH